MWMKYGSNVVIMIDFGIYFKCDKIPLEDLEQESIFTDV